VQVIGYDPDSIDYPNVSTSGVDELRADIYAYLKTCKKGAVLDILRYDILFAWRARAKVWHGTRETCVDIYFTPNRNGLLNLASNDATMKFATIGLAVLVAVMKAKR
jgi:hypothetical protein